MPDNLPSFAEAAAKFFQKQPSTKLVGHDISLPVPPGGQIDPRLQHADGSSGLLNELLSRAQSIGPPVFHVSTEPPLGAMPMAPGAGGFAALTEMSEPAISAMSQKALAALQRVGLTPAKIFGTMAPEARNTVLGGERLAGLLGKAPGAAQAAAGPVGRTAMRATIDESAGPLKDAAYSRYLAKFFR